MYLSKIANLSYFSFWLSSLVDWWLHLGFQPFSWLLNDSKVVSMTDKAIWPWPCQFSEHHIITAKLVGAFIWSILSSTVLVLSAFIIVTITVPEWISNSELIPLVGTFLPQLSLMGVSFLLNTISGILCIYLAISIGQLFNEYRTALAVAAYIGIQIVIGLLKSSSIPVLTSILIHLQDSMIISIWEQA